MSKLDYVSNYGDLSNGILLNVSEILILRLPEGIERIIASKWLKKFIVCDPTAYKNNLQLFVNMLTKKVLVEPFDIAPEDQSDQWKNFPQEYTTADVDRFIKMRYYRDSKTPPYKTEFSQNLCEYVAYQEIPYFGAHFYYAFSPKERIDTWQNFNKLHLPRKYVKALQLSSEEVSPIKARPMKIARKPCQKKGFGFRPGMATKQAARPATSTGQPEKPATSTGQPERPATSTGQEEKPAASTKDKPKPGWQGPISSDEPETQKEPTVSMPTAPDYSHLPPKLRKLMEKAENDKQEKLKKLVEEDAKRKRRAATPAVARKGTKPAVVKKGAKPVLPKGATSKTPGVSTSFSKTPAEGLVKGGPGLRKKVLKKKGFAGDNIDQELGGGNYMKPQATAPEVIEIPQAEPEQPVEYGPMSQSIYRKMRMDELRKSNVLSDELRSSPREIFRATKQLAEEALRRRQQQDQEGESRKKSPRKARFSEGVEDVNKSFSDLVFDAEKILSQSKASPPRVENLAARFNRIREGMKATKEKFEEDIRNETRNSGDDLLEKMEETIHKSFGANDQLLDLEPNTPEEEEIINRFIQSNNKLIVDVTEIVPNLIDALENDAANLAELIKQYGKKLNESITKSNAKDEETADSAKASEVGGEAGGIQDERNATINSIAEEALNISRKAEATVEVLKAQNDLRDFVGDYYDQDFKDIVDAVSMEDDIDLDEIPLMTDEEMNFNFGPPNKKDLVDQKLISEEKRLRAEFAKEFETIFQAKQLDDPEVITNYGTLLDESMKFIDDVEEAVYESLEERKTRETQEKLAKLKESIKKVKETIEKEKKEIFLVNLRERKF